MKTMSFVSGSEVEEGLHLSEEQIDDELMGDLGAEAAAHLAECAQCSQRVAEGVKPIAAFRDVTMAWAERRSATMPIPVVQAGALVWQRRVGWAMTACALVVGISVTSSARRAEIAGASAQAAQIAETATVAGVQATPVATTAKRVEEEATTERYSGDNRMLKAIDRELDASVETPAAMGLETVSEQPRSQSGQISVED